MSGLEGMRVAILEGRMSTEMAGLVRRQGGEPVSVPAVRETPVEAPEEVAAFIDALSGGSMQVAVFLTGAGARALFHEAEQLGRLPELLSTLKQAKTVCRGPKPSAALTREGVPVSIAVPPPHTTSELLTVITALGLADSGVGLVHYGERDGTLAQALRARGAHLQELCLYEWLLPEDLGPLQALVRDSIAGRVDAITFTSQVQARHLFQVAAAMGLTADLISALNSRLVVASLGPTCANALRALGVTPHVVPEHSKMGHLVLALAAHLASSRQHA